MNVFKSGKLPWSILSNLLSKLPLKDIDLIMGPAIGEDAAIIRFKDGFLVIHSDPITTASSRIGWLAIHIASNDIAVRGVKPKWFLPVVLIPENYSLDQLNFIFEDMGRALDKIEGIVIGGHTEISPGLTKPIISTTAIGYTTGRVILTRDARPGDRVIVIGKIGLEGAGVIAYDFGEILIEKGVDRNYIEDAKKYIDEISIVDKALVIKDYVNTMHDPTEGGVIQSFREIALASNTSITVDIDSIELDEKVVAITSVLGLDPFKLLSSGSIVATVPEKNLLELINIMDSMKIDYSICGYVSRENPGKVFIRKNNKVVDIGYNDIVDEIYKLWR
ncbi:MAG: AIR synthase family protein [Desulfurococcaceae archaeon]